MRLSNINDFKNSSKIAALKPMLNSKIGPMLNMIQESPFPRFSTAHSIEIGNDEEKEI